MGQGQQEFKASSGRVVKVQENGAVVFDHVNGYITAEMVMDAVEFFQAKHDADLGRWRHPLDPHFVVYVMDSPDTVRVIDERDASCITALRSDVNGFEPQGVTRSLYKAAWDYFEAHPERKPWQDAKPGEVWVLTVPDWGDADAEMVTVTTSYGTFTAGSLREWTLNDPTIISARLVPTEVTA